MYYFYAGGEEQVFLASADLMQRNLYRRVEVGFPIRDPDLKERVIREGLQVYLEAVDGAWIMDTDGEYSTHPQPCYDLSIIKGPDLNSSRGESANEQGQKGAEETEKMTLRPKLIVEDDFISAQSWLLNHLISKGN